MPILSTAERKHRYAGLCQESSIPLFMQAWWLDALCGPERWNVALVDNGSAIAGALVYFERRVFGRRVITMPPLTQVMGPWLNYPRDQKPSRRAGYEKWVLAELIHALPEFIGFYQRFHHEVTNWLPFYWNGFGQRTRYTYVLEDITDLDATFRNIERNYRSKMRKASQVVDVVEDLDPLAFFDLSSLTFARQNVAVPYSRDAFVRMDEALAKRDARKIFGAIDAAGNLHSGVYLIWDRSTAYLHMVADHPKWRASGAGILLVWKAVCFASAHCRVRRFDFEGSMMESIEQVRRDFGAVQKPYFVITKGWRGSAVLEAMDGRIRRVSTFFTGTALP